MTGRVVTLGNAIVDIVARVPRLPERGGDVLALGGGLEAGGGGLRAVTAAAAEGVPVLFLGRIGTGLRGDLVRAVLADRGIGAPLPPVPDRDTGYAVVLVEPDGERTFATVPGAESAAPGLRGIALLPGDHLHVHGYGLVPPGRAATVADAVAALPDDVVVLLDPGPFGADAPPAPMARLLRRTDWWSGNRAEARAVTGETNPQRAAPLLAATVRRGAVVRLGADGCLLARRGAEPVHLPAPPVVAVDTNGAGDVHVGVFLAALARGLNPVEGARAANAAAGRAVAGDRG